jgi:hypothetical protein
VVLAVSVLLNVLLVGRGYERSDEDVRGDTLVVRDTVRIVEPVYIKEEVIKYEKVMLPVIDTIVKIDTIDRADSVEVMVPITERVYEDTTYRAVVRGYKPELVSLDIYNSTKTITITKTKQPKVVVGIGPYAGFGNKGFNYGIAVNVSMPIWSW